MNDEWLKENYEKVVLIAATVIAVVLSGWLMAKGLRFGETFERPAPRISNEMPETGIARLELASAALDEPVLWKGEHLFVSAPVLEKDGRLEPVGEGAVHFPITDDWIKKYDLPMTHANLKNEDPDRDNFTNLEEFLGGTDPNDANSHPEFITKLCLDSMVESDLQLVFRGEVDPTTWQIDLVSPGGKYRGENFLVRKTVKFGPDDNDMFRMDGYQEKKRTDERGVPVDESEVTISYVEAGGNVRVTQTLVREEPWELPTHEGNFLDRYDNKEFTAQRGSSFKLDNDPDHVFTVVEVNSQMALLKDQTGKEYQIPPCN